MAAKTDANCIFCKIIAGQIPSLKLYDSDKTYAFLGEFACVFTSVASLRLTFVWRYGQTLDPSRRAMRW